MDKNKIIYLLLAIVIILLIACFAVSSTTFAKQDTAIKVTSNDTLYDGDYFSISLNNVNGTPLANQVVNITIIDANGAENHQQITTNESGSGKLQLNGLTPNNYTFKVTYGGNDSYNGCNATQKITIAKKVVEEPVNQQSKQSTQSSSSSSGLHYDPEINLYYNDDGIIVDPDGKHFQGAGDSYSKYREARDRWERGEPVMV